MGIERRREPRWKASSNKYKALVVSEKGVSSTATIVDVSKSGIGLRADGRHLKAGMRVRVEIDLLGETVEVKGVVRFADRFYPRIGLLAESTDSMEKVVQHAETHGFLLTELIDETLVVKGTVTLAAESVFKTTSGHRQIDLSGVNEITIGGAHHVYRMTQAGVKILCCSEAVAPLFGSLGMCRGARLCVADTPCDLPKKWPMRPEFLASRNRLDSSPN